MTTGSLGRIRCPLRQSLDEAHAVSAASPVPEVVPACIRRRSPETPAILPRPRLQRRQTGKKQTPGQRPITQPQLQQWPPS